MTWGVITKSEHDGEFLSRVQEALKARTVPGFTHDSVSGARNVIQQVVLA